MDNKTIVFLISADLPCEGKDAAADAIIKEVNLMGTYAKMNAKKIYFGEEVKRQACERNGLDFERMMNDIQYKKEKRPFLTSISEERRKENPDYWCEALAYSLNKNIELKDDSVNILIIPDTRYRNEISFMKNLFKNIWHIHVTATEDRMKKTIIKDSEYSGWIELLDNHSEKELIVGKNVSGLFEEDTIPDLIISNNYKKNTFEKMIAVYANDVIFDFITKG